MTAKEQLLQELEHAPDELLEEVLKFILANKTHQPASTTHETPSSPEQPSGLAALVAMAERFAAELTEEELAQLPSDGALEHDHYIYGTPKRYNSAADE